MRLLRRLGSQLVHLEEGECLEAPVRTKHRQCVSEKHSALRQQQQRAQWRYSTCDSLLWHGLLRTYVMPLKQQID